MNSTIGIDTVIHKTKKWLLMFYWKTSNGSTESRFQSYIFFIISLASLSQLACQTANSLNAWKKPALKVFRDRFGLTVSKISNARRIYFELFLFTETKSIINARSLYFLDCERPSRIDFFITGRPFRSIILNKSIILVGHDLFDFLFAELNNLRFFGWTNKLPQQHCSYNKQWM